MYGITFTPSGQSQYHQLVSQLRAKITQGQLPGGSRLASTRDLSASLGIARGIVVEAVEQLAMEGYLRPVPGSGTYVNSNLVWPGPIQEVAPEAGIVPSRPGRPPQPLLSFLPGVPDPALFPRRAWLGCYRQAVEYATDEDLGYNRASGRLDLREAIVRHLFETKGIQSRAAQILVTAGSAQAFALLAQMFRPGPFLLEDPQAPFLRRIFEEFGGRVIDAEVDEHGLLPDRIAEGPLGLIYATPAHQFPLGGTLPADRRVGLLTAAERAGAWIVEDDFDSEFRYGHHPVPPLQVMAPDRVIYVGSFSKTLSPALRLGFVVVPEDLLAAAKQIKSRWDQWNEGFQQKTMAEFIHQGHLERHLRHSRDAYRRKNQAVQGLVRDHLGDEWILGGATTGTHVLLRMGRSWEGPRRASLVSDALRRRRIQVEPVSVYCRTNHRFDDALVVGFGNRSLPDLETLVLALRDLSPLEVTPGS